MFTTCTYLDARDESRKLIAMEVRAPDLTLARGAPLEEAVRGPLRDLGYEFGDEE